MAVRKENADGTVTYTTEDEEGGPTGLVAMPKGPVTLYADGVVPDSKAVQTAENKAVKKATSK